MSEQLKAELAAAQAKLKETEASLATAQAATKTATEQAATALATAASFAENAQAARSAGFVSFAEGQVKAGKLLPKDRAMAVATLDHFDTQAQAVEFGEGEARAPLLDKFKTFLQALPEAVSFSEHATKDKAGVSSVDFADAASIANAATAVQAAAERNGQSITHASAVAQVVAGQAK